MAEIGLKARAKFIHTQLLRISGNSSKFHLSYIRFTFDSHSSYVDDLQRILSYFSIFGCYNEQYVVYNHQIVHFVTIRTLAIC